MYTSLPSFVLLNLLASSLAAPPLHPPATLSQLLINLRINPSNSSTPPLPLIQLPPSVPNILIKPPPSLSSTNLTEDHPSDEYIVPGTPLTLSIGYWPSPSRDLSPTILHRSLIDLQRRMTEHLVIHGDSPLRAHHDDPFRETRPGFYFIASSTPIPSEEGSQLTYRYLLETLIGLYDVLVIAEKPWGAYVMITHEELELLGTAVVLPGPPN